ncbi:MAG: efflux RND transporter periplasmic adaptor subunit [Rhodobacteraceae bacterium]|nr:efflux RND transporter periplasmic adaptor subunit [Paracoccaceae bacterium]
MALIRRFILILVLSPGLAVADEPLAVGIVTAEARADQRIYSLTGEAVAREPLSAAFPTGGRVAAVLVDAGDRVAAGAELARIESVQQEQALRAAEAGLATAGADHRQAAENLDRQDALLERGATTRIARDSAEDALRIAEGVLAQAGADLDRARKALADTVLLAPHDATVTQRMIEAGQVVGAAQPALELALGDGMDAVFDVPEVLLAGALPPPDVTLALLDSPEREFAGHVREVSPLVDPRTGTVTVTVTITDPPDDLDFGEPVRGTVVIEDVAHVALPYTAMSAAGDSPAVWVVDPATMTVALHPVAIERFETGRIVLSGGLDDGVLVVTNGAQLLYPGRKVLAAEAVQ